MNPIERLTELFERFPGIGPRQARRFVQYLLAEHPSYRSNLSDAIRAAREVARRGPVGDLVTIIDSRGMGVRQFVLLSEGTVAEVPISRQDKPAGIQAEANGPPPGATADRSREAGSS